MYSYFSIVMKIKLSMYLHINTYDQFEMLKVPSKEKHTITTMNKIKT